MEDGHTHVTDHDRAFLSSAEGRMLVVTFGLTVHDVEVYLNEPNQPLANFVAAHVSRQNLPGFWERYESSRAKWSHPGV
jgi:hypothetical protein